MTVMSIWESNFPGEAAREGAAVTSRIWEEMSSFHGYLGHQLIVDADDPGHLLVVSWWASRKAADDVLEAYREHPNARRANELVSQPRGRFIGRPLVQGFE